jgi:hypothetical protein
MLTSTFRYDTGEAENRLKGPFPLKKIFWRKKILSWYLAENEEVPDRGIVVPPADESTTTFGGFR